MHPHDTRRLLCANPGCHNMADEKCKVILVGPKVLHYCCDECKDRHMRFLTQHAKELLPEFGTHGFE